MSDHFYLFTAWATLSRTAQTRLQQASSPQEIIAIAHEKGYQITVEQLSHFAHRLTEPHWVWHGRPQHWRREFFARMEQQQQTA